MRGQSNLTPLRSKDKVTHGQVVVSLAKECLHSLCVLCRTGNRTVTQVTSSTLTFDAMGSWKVGDMGWGCFSSNRNTTASISVLACGGEEVCAVLGFTMAGVLKEKEKKRWLFSALASFLLRLRFCVCVCLSLFMRMFL